MLAEEVIVTTLAEVAVKAAVGIVAGDMIAAALAVHELGFPKGLVFEVDEEIRAEGTPFGFVEVEEGDGGIIGRWLWHWRWLGMLVFRDEGEVRGAFRISDLTVEFDEGETNAVGAHRVLAVRHAPCHVHTRLPT